MTKKIIFRGQISPIMSAIRMGGDVMRISFDVPLTERANAIGILALTDQPLRFAIEVDNSPASTRIQRPEEVPDKPPKEPAGPYSAFWNRMCASGKFKTYPDLQEALDCTFDQVWDRLHVEFETDTMATVSPRQWEAWVTEQGLPEGLITLSRNAEQQAAAREN